MSSHSRSSSEVETIQYREVLPVFIEDFMKDFSFDDVKLMLRELFTKDEYAAIINEKDEKRQIRQLFWVLCQNEKIIPTFLQAITLDYQWLSNLVQQEYNLRQHKNTENYVEALRILCSNNQKHTDYNVHRMEFYEQLRRALKKLTAHKYVVLTGELGMGKKWLTIDVCSEYTIQRTMNFKIYWIDVSQCTSREADLRALQKLRLLLGDSNISLSPAASGSIYRPNLEYFDSISNRILELQQYLSFILRQDEYKNALLILTDVQNVKTWQTFNLGCKLLLITRNKKVSESLSPTMTTHIDIDHGLTLTEFYCLFERYLRRSRETFPANATDIYYQSKGHPYLLSIIAQNLRQKKLRNWDEWITKLQNLRIDDNKFSTVIELSLNVLQPEQLELYATFAIFPYSIVIPVKLLAALWNQPQYETEQIVHKFHKYSIVNEVDLPDGTTACTVPFIYSSHLKGSQRMQRMINSSELHWRIIDYYKVEEAFKKRTEIDLCNSQHDLFFFQCIGYHIYEANCKHLFERLYLDFGFLGQKFRAVGFLNTIGDLKYYKEDIINGDPRRRDLLNALLEFLPNIEDMLVRSVDTCLLQYALMADGPVYEEALRQAKQFPDRVWFSEIGLFHQRRQIVNLPHKPTLLKFLDDDICLIVLDNNDMLLADLSLDYNNGPVYLSNDMGGVNRDSKIREAQLIRDDNFIVTLDTNGELKLWGIGDDRRRSLVRRRSSKQMVNPLNFNHFTAKHSSVKKCKQSIHSTTLGVRTKIVAFYIAQLPPKYDFDTHLHVVYENGDVCMFNWHVEREEFQSMRVPPLHTRLSDTRFLCKILDKYYMMLNKAGNISFWNLRDSSRAAVSFEWPRDTFNLLCYEVHTCHQHTCIIFIFGHKILRLTFEHQRFAVLVGKLETLYEFTADPQSAITCGRLTRNGRYLVLGTKRGLIVFDTYAKSEILRSNVSEAISCVDIYSLDDVVYKYIIVCGSEHTNILNIFSLRDTGKNSVAWAHSVAEISCQASERPQLEPNVWLLGQKLYDIRFQGDKTWLLAADSKYRIHQVCTTDTKQWSILTPAEVAHQRITAVTACTQNSFIGYENGDIFNVSQENFEPSFTLKAISYLQLLNDNILVASARQDPSTLVLNVQSGVKVVCPTQTNQCYQLFGRYLLLINELGYFLVLDMENQFQLLHKVDEHDENEVGHYAMAGCDMKNAHLFVATSTFNIYVYSFTQDENSLLKIHNRTYFSKNEKTEKRITCLTATNDANLIAIGLKCGEIEVYRMLDNNISFLYSLQSHASPVYDLKFSPFSDVLVSCAEQLCFWHVAHMLNNPLEMGSKKRRSSRFSSQRSSDIEEVDAVAVQRHQKQLQVNDLISDLEVEEAFKKRTEIDLCNSQHDLFFFQCIGYHIYEANCKHLFERLYLDFGFLGQKFRAVGFLNTIGDLKYYKEDIINGDPRRRDLLNALLEFLPNIEDMLVRSVDTCLLQYALMADGPVYEEALRQAKQFPDRVWFSEIGLFHQRRQIVNLPHKPTLLKFLDDDICLIVLDNNDMLLADLSLDYNNGPVYLSNDMGGVNRDSKIREAQLIRDDNFIVTLDTNGELKLWGIGDDRRRSLVRRRSSKQMVNPLNFNHFTAKHSSVKKCKQSIHSTTLGVRTKIVAFYIAQLPPKYDFDTHLHVVYENGDVCMFNWHVEREEFQSMRVPPLHTRLSDTRFLCKILDKYYMMLNKAGNISFWNLRDSSRAAVSFEWPRDTFNLLCYEVHTCHQHTCIIFIFGHKILRLTFEHQRFAVLVGKLETLYEFTADPQSAITCGRLTRNGRYLVLGTKRGLIVFDTYAKSEILRSNVSEAISCVDIYSLDDVVYKYIIVCGSEHTNILNIFSLRDTGKNSVAWAHSVAEISCQASERPQLEPNVWLLGQKLYDIRFQGDKTWLLAADSKYRIHQVCTTDTKQWSILTPAEVAHQRITAVTACTQNSFIGYENGDIFNVSQENFEPSFTLKAISYLQLLNDNILVASARQDPSTLVLNVQSGVKVVCPTQTNQCYQLFGRYLLLINELGYFLVLDMENQFQLLHKVDEHDENEVGHYAMAGCDMKNAHLFVATSTFNIYVYSFTQDENSLLKIHNRTYFSKNEKTEKRITCLTATNDANLIAIGLKCGEIEVYRMLDNNISFLYSLQSHASPVYDLKFSPFSDVLVSCAEQLCFWHVAHMLNNPLEMGSKKRRSSRFSSQRSSDIEEVDAVAVQRHQKQLQVNDLISDLEGTSLNGEAAVLRVNHWKNKRGPAEKPELLACIKFVGNKAEKIFANAAFTQFNTIDDEGVYYHLTLLELNEKEFPSAQSSPSSSTSSAVIAIQTPLTTATTIRRSSSTKLASNGYARTNGKHPVDDGDPSIYDDNVII